MSDDHSPLSALFVSFAFLSLFTIGGVNAALPEIQRQVVHVHGWMTDQRFADLFAIAQAAPGPNIIVVTLVGWDIAGVPGALLTTIAMFVPTSVAAYIVGHFWHRFRLARWRIAIQAGVTPITVGLVAASAFLLARAVDTNVVAVLITLASATALTLTRVHPLVFLAIGAAIGSAGLV
jgi:chromate transporter